MMNIFRLTKILIIIRWLSSLKITLVCLSILFILTFWGTLAQIDQGLYLAQKRFFHSYIFTIWGFIPFPGTQLVLGILFLNLLAVGMARFEYQWSHLGIAVLHGGLLLYLLSAFITFHNTVESHVNLMERGGTNLSSDYREWEISLWKKAGQEREVNAIDINALKPGQILSFTKDGLSAMVKLYYPHCQAFMVNDEIQHQSINPSGIGLLKPLPLNKEFEKNIPGVVLQVDSQQGEKSEILLYGGETQAVAIQRGNEKFFVQLRRKKYLLPFTLILKDFKMEVHPQTEIARSYQSLVKIQYDQISRDVLISMNKPLRFKDFTLYQAAYSLDSLGREYSTLAVVQNSGRWLPYISGILTFLGLVIHFSTMAFNKKFRTIRFNLS